MRVGYQGQRGSKVAFSKHPGGIKWRSARGGKCKSQKQDGEPSSVDPVCRRQLAQSLLFGAGAFLLPSKSANAAAQAVSEYLPASQDAAFALYQPSFEKTPALRAGVIENQTPYSFVIPNSWGEAKIPNALTGNFCMPNCGEPWIECIFEDPQEGKLQLVVYPLQKLTSVKQGTPQDIGAPEDLVVSLGNFITGTFILEDDVEAKLVMKDGRQFYQYEVYAPYSKSGGPHCLAQFTTKDSNAYMLVTYATDKQWPKSEKKLRSVLESFQP